MVDSRVHSGANRAGIVSKIRLENFMCHSNLEIQLGDFLNFVTGQNGSGKSAILTALCVAFGCRARGTQRASSLKDFIKTGCSYALVHVELKNKGEDAFKPETYVDNIIIERRISEATSSTILKDHQGKRVASRKEDLIDIVEHFNIDVENPCVIMSQDKSREFLHSGNAKDKFKFFFKATLLHHVDDLLKSIEKQLNGAQELVGNLENSIRPILKELSELQGKIKSMEQFEEISQRVQLLKKKLAWAHVYDIDDQIQQAEARIEKLKGRIPHCEDLIARQTVKMEGLEDRLAKKKAQIAILMERTSEVRKMKEELQHNRSEATKERSELEQDCIRRVNEIKRIMKRAEMLEQQIRDISDQDDKHTQAEEHEMEENLSELKKEVEEAVLQFERYKKDEDSLSNSIANADDDIQKVQSEIEVLLKKDQQNRSSIRDLRLHQTNKVTAFGGNRVTNLLRAIERHHYRFGKPPIGPIGAHLKLVGGDRWAFAVENAVGRLFNAFIVNDHKDNLVLRACAREASYNNLQIIIHDFSRPRLNIPDHMLPQINHPTTISVLCSENATVMNVLIDVGHAERQVLVSDYSVGKSVAFDRNIQNLKEVYTLEGYKMFSRRSAQTTLPPNRNARTGRLCSSYDDQIKSLEKDALRIQEEVQQVKGKKRYLEETHCNLRENFQLAKRRRIDAEGILRSKKFALQDAEKSYALESNSRPTSNVDELYQDLSLVRNEIQEKESKLKEIQVRSDEAKIKASELKASFENLCESAKAEILAFEKEEKEMMQIEEDLHSAKAERNRYEVAKIERVIPNIKEAELRKEELENKRKVNYKKASIICPESEIEALGGHDGSTPEQLSAQLTRLNQRLQQESQKYPESIDDLRMMHDKKERKILRKQQTYKMFRQKLHACQKSLELRYSKFQRNATLLKRQLTWQFNGHLRKKGISGQIKISYEDETLSIEVKMPQDASNNSVRDTRGLSGGERSFSTLCFALALHEMTEAPFRAMDEFDVFMDAVSRKISLDTLVDFALAQGSQWIFITPHDISMVKQDERIKKQQMAAPRS